ncbi:HAD-IIIC family phosphatase [Pseudofrankia inefficax]|uniref:FkbH like protein n=1 Tax=Pseudofrankia inefficax (strain DSM 45817 / CECT 9037 / DDB 130130 / EuI1c) TaxID=298654 RepID=E3JBT7_PSEI1|nr:HAD-IIIC family phosphatase [Pseudofrankia inefficax]ADP82247.1 FkbH like protein [Pseudofrankia inefficax]
MNGDRSAPTSDPATMATRDPDPPTGASPRAATVIDGDPVKAWPSAAERADTALRDLRRRGGLAAEFAELSRILDELAPSRLAAAGNLIATLDPAEILRANPTVTAVTVAVTGHGTLGPLVPVLTAELARHRLLARPTLGAFGSYVFDLGDPASELYAADPDLVLCVLDQRVVLDELPTPWRVEDLERVVTARLATVEELVDRFQRTARGTLVLNTLPLGREATAAVVDYRSRARLGAIWREANARLLRLAETSQRLVVVDLDPLLAGGLPAVDPRHDLYAGAHLSAQLLAGYAREIGHLARHLTGRTRKVLVVDLDETVWGGVLGEVGPDGIEVVPADGYRGGAFQAFQRTVKQIGSQGVLLAAVSKNDPDLVRTALRDRDGMTLREEDFVRVVANWRPKHENLAELAAALNLGLDSFVFVDDSPAERGLVRRELPEVAVVAVDDEPAGHRGALLADGWFDVRELTGQDRSRLTDYRTELDRKDFLDTFDSIEDYLRELGVQVRLRAVRPSEIGRVSQLTLRTNQFNLTGLRLQPPDVRRLVEDDAGLVVAIHARDRFGDNGLVGAMFASHPGDVWSIENFLLSCRVFSRGIEQASLLALLRHAQRSGATQVVGAYRATARNGKVRDFYPRSGFVPTGGADDGLGGPAGPGDDAAPVSTWRHDLTHIAAPPPHVALTQDLGGKP